MPPDTEELVDEKIVVAIESDLFETTEKTKDAEPAAELKAQFDELKGQAERDRQAAQEATRRAADAERDAARAREETVVARNDATESQFTTIESGIAAAQAEAEAAAGEYKTAFEAGNADALTTAQRKIARAEARIVRLDEAKADLESRKVKAPTEADTRRKEEQQRRPDPSVDPVEEMISRYTAPAAKWLREHKDYVTDPRKNAKLTAAHYDALGDGLTADTPEYFEYVETKIGLRQNGADKGNGQQQPKQPRRPTVPVAPVQQTGGGTNGGGQQVVLTRGEAAAAQDGTHVWNYDDPSGKGKFKKGDPIGTQEFARRKLAMTAQGLYDKTYVEQ